MLCQDGTVLFSSICMQLQPLGTQKRSLPEEPPSQRWFVEPQQPHCWCPGASCAAHGAGLGPDPRPPPAAASSYCSAAQPLTAVPCTIRKRIRYGTIILHSQLRSCCCAAQPLTAVSCAQQKECLEADKHVMQVFTHDAKSSACSSRSRNLSQCTAVAESVLRLDICD